MVETTWHRIVIWQGEGCPDLGIIQKGAKLHVLGRLRMQKYTGADGIERETIEVKASRVELVKR